MVDRHVNGAPLESISTRMASNHLLQQRVHFDNLLSEIQICTPSIFDFPRTNLKVEQVS